MDQNLILWDKCLVYIWLLSVQLQFGVILCFSNFRRPCILKSYLVYMRYLWLLTCQSQSEVIRYISDFPQPCILKTAGRRAKRTKIWASWGKYLVYRAHLPSSVQRQSEVIRCISHFTDFRQSCIFKKQLVVEWNGKFGPRRLYLIHTEYFWLFSV